MARGAIPPSPLPPRHGVDAQRFRMPQHGAWRTLRDHLVERLAPGLGADEVDRMLADGEFVDEHGGPVPAGAAFEPQSVVWAHRDLPNEVPPPRSAHGAAPRRADRRRRQAARPGDDAARAPRRAERPGPHPGAHRSRPAHAGPSPRPSDRRRADVHDGAALARRLPAVFAEGLAHKEYLAVAPVRHDLDLPLVRRTHLVKEHGTHQAQEVPGAEPNAETFVELLDTAPPSDGAGETLGLFPF